MGLGTELGGRNEDIGPNGALQGASLDALADLGASMEGSFGGNHGILDISDPMLMQAHTSAVGLMRCNMDQLALTMPPEPGSDTISFFNMSFPNFVLETSFDDLSFDYFVFKRFLFP